MQCENGAQLVSINFSFLLLAAGGATTIFVTFILSLINIFASL